MKGKHIGDSCWKKPHESCRLGSRPECNVCVDALNQVVSRLKDTNINDLSPSFRYNKMW